MNRHASTLLSRVLDVSIKRKFILCHNGGGPALNRDRRGRLAIVGIGFHQWRSNFFDMGVREESFFSQSNSTVQMQVQVLLLQASWLSRLILLLSCYHRSRIRNL